MKYIRYVKMIMKYGKDVEKSGSGLYDSADVSSSRKRGKTPEI
jgi:hypothetical protein